MDSLVGLKPRGRQTLVVDQAEEAVTLCADPAERARYFAALALHVGAGGALVLALRADHLGDLAPYPEIARVLEDGMYLLGPMSEPGLRSAIEGPARRAGLRLEPGLVDLLVREVEGEPAALPLLSHVLRETWERREGPTLTVAGYRATGGIRQAVSRSAESLYDAMDATQRGQLRSLLLRLVMPTEDGDPVRARVPRTKVAVDAAHERLVELLVEARLVSIDGDTVQIAHEALVRVWPRLRGWLDDDVDGQRLFRHLAGAADAWEAMGRPEQRALPGHPAQPDPGVAGRARTPDLNDTETAFLDASVALSAAEQRAAETRMARERRSRRRLRGALAGVGVFLVLALVAGILAVRNAEQAEQDRRDRDGAARLAEARRAGAQASGAGEHRHRAAARGRGPERRRLRAGVGQPGRRTDRGRGRCSCRRSGRDDRLHVGQPRRTAALPSACPRTRPACSTPGRSSGSRSRTRRLRRASSGSRPDGRQLAVAVNQWTLDRQGPPRIDEQPVRLYDMPGGTLSTHQLGGMPDGRQRSSTHWTSATTADASPPWSSTTTAR